MKRHPHETRSECIIRHVRVFLRGSAMSEQSYAADVVEVYHARTPAGRRCMKFHEGGDPYRDMRANGQIIGRILNGDVKMPVDLEESLILALPEEDARLCWVDLAERVGRLSVAHPQDGIEGMTADLGRLASDFGQFFESAGPLLHDLSIDARDDRAQLMQARDRARQLVAQASGFVHEISEALREQDHARTHLREVG